MRSSAAPGMFTYSASNLPAGLTINSSTGLISGSIGNQAADASPYSVTVSASDAHNTTSRPPVVSAAFALIESRNGLADAQRMFIDTPARILRNEMIEPVAGGGVRSKKRGRSFGEFLSHTIRPARKAGKS